MKKEVIALRGKGKVGKSQTICKTYYLLRNKHETAKREYEILRKIDIRVIITINGVKIGIESQGDPGGRLKKSLLLFVNVGCTIIICATRTSGQTVNVVNDMQPNYEVLWLEQVVKLSESDQRVSNDAMAERIVREVEKAMGA